jgi:hypothetical protein
MAARLLLHPFRISTSGSVAAAEQGSDAYIDSQLRVVIGTRLGERPMCPPFGVPDPGFAVLSPDDVQTCLDQFGPDDVTVTAVTTGVGSDTTTVDVQWAAVAP